MICPLFLAAKLEGINTGIKPTTFLDESQCLGDQCGFWNYYLSACGQSHPEAASIDYATSQVERIAKSQ